MAMQSKILVIRAKGLASTCDILGGTGITFEHHSLHRRKSKCNQLLASKFYEILEGQKCQAKSRMFSKSQADVHEQCLITG